MNITAYIPVSAPIPRHRYTFLLGVCIAIALVLVSPAAVAASFRPVPALPDIPPSVTNDAERQILTDDREQLRERRARLLRLQEDYRRDCAARMTAGNSVRRRCSFRLQEIFRQSAQFGRDIDALRTRFRTVEDNILRQRHRDGIQPAGNNSGPREDRRLNLARDFLSTGGDNWENLLGRMRDARAKAAGDPVLRDVAAYLSGMYRGEIAAENLGDPYYKHGVRRWLARDYWSAALSFARAARDNPEDARVFASFAVVSGRQHASPACARSGRCVSGDIAAWARRFGVAHERHVKRLVSRMRRATVDASLAEYRSLQAIAVFAAQHLADDKPGPALADRAARALSQLRRPADAAAVREYVRIWQESEPRRARIFHTGYSIGAGKSVPPNDFGAGLSGAGVRYGFAGQQADGAYLKKIREALGADPKADPFTGALTRAQIIRLQR